MISKNSQYLLRGTPSLLLPLGAGFVMASSADIRAALGMGIAVILTMLISSIIISAIRKLIPDCARVPAFLLIITGTVSLIDMLMQAHTPDIVNMLGVHLAALAVSAVPYRDAEEVAGVSGEGKTIKISLLTGLFFTAILVVCALIREILGNATLAGKPIELLANYKVSALAGAFGGYVVLAIVLAAIRKIGSMIKAKEEK